MSITEIISPYLESYQNFITFDRNFKDGKVHVIPKGKNHQDFCVDYKTAQSKLKEGQNIGLVAGNGLTGGGTSGSVTVNVVGGTGITANANDIAIDSTVTTLTGSQTLTNKTLTSPVLNGTLSGTAFLDEDNFASDSATAVASQQSIKAYVATQVATANELSELTDTNITTPADGALLFYDTTTSKWIDNVVSGDMTIDDAGVGAIGTGVSVDGDVNSSAAIDG